MRNPQIMSRKLQKRVRKEKTPSDLGGPGARAVLERVARFPLQAPMKIHYGDSRWKVSDPATRCREGAASFVQGK